MNNAVKVWDKEIKGKVFAVGDLHGCYNLLITRLNTIGFDFENDLLVSVGDLVDRGPQNLECISLLEQPWFTAVRGNHEELCIHGLSSLAHKQCHVGNGGEWFYALDSTEQNEIIQKFEQLPIVLEVSHHGKKFGFVHGHIEENDWDEFKASFFKESLRDADQLAMWNRNRFDSENKQYTKVGGVDAVFLGHTVTPKPFKRDNCYFIDTGAVHWATLTVLDLDKV
ncbi:metallophosphoesterase [Acinetobacter sp. B10A]|uniref:metallophosphoesterase n=1 Tax=Acinetobacter baretiae TaxID=2605383 RepID=UPI001B3C4F69|nr:metallophosphoesterase [Acinetobacter baretiae]MBF7685931.1 metallophosphoesterase [Acinetobacter baretiae]